MANPEILTQSIGDTSIQYLYYPGEGPVVIMLHATGFLPWLWHPIARELAGRFRVVAPYFCDHRHAEPEDGLEWMQLADDLCVFCRELAIEKPLLVGHSMGATIMTLAEAIHGPVSEKMIIIEPIFLPGDFYKINITMEQHPLASKSIKRKNHWNGKDDAMQYLKSRALFRNWDEEMLELYIAYGMVPGETGGLSLACSPHREAALFMGSVKYDPWPLLPRVQCPVLVLEGETSENRHFIDLKAAAEAIPGGEHLMVKNAGHLIPMEKPAEVIRIIREFFDK